MGFSTGFSSGFSGGYPATYAVGVTHHVKIGTEYCMLNNGGYQKRAAPTFGARVSSGDPDYNNLSIWQHWVQTCWAGGLGADVWVDDSMYDRGVGVDSTVHEQLTLTRDLLRATGGALNAGSLDKVRKFYIFGGVLYCLTLPASNGTTSYLWKYTSATWSIAKTFTNWRAQSIFAWNGKLLVGGENGTISWATNPSGSWTDQTPPSGVTAGVTAMGGFNSRLYVAHGTDIWRRKPNLTEDGTTVFYEAASQDSINNFKVHLGFLYFSSKDGHIFRTDSNNTFDIWHWDSHTYVTSLQSFDGKLFVATYEFTDTADLGQGVLYQLTGSAVTQLKRWGKFDRATSLGGMIVYDRKMYYGASGLWGMNVTTAGSDLAGFGVAVYDVVEDAHSIWATNKDTTTYTDGSGNGRDYVVDDIAFFGGVLHASVRNHGLFKTPLSYRDYLEARASYDVTATTATGNSSQGFILSSDYDGGTPGLLKLWRQILIQGDIPSDNVSAKVYYSLDAGTTWTSAGTLTRTLTGTVSTAVATAVVTGSGTKFRTEVSVGDSIDFGTQTKTVLSITSDTSLTCTANLGADQSGATARHNKTRMTRVFRLENVRGPRFMYRLELSTTDATVSPIIRGISVSYLPQPEPNWMWALTVPVADQMELLDGTVEDVDTSTRLAYFRDLFRQQKLFTFTDITGEQWEVNGSSGVLMYDYTEDQHLPGIAGEPEEALCRIILLETAESY